MRALLRARTMSRRLLLLLMVIWVLAPLAPLFLWSASHGWFFPDILPSAWSGRAWRYVLAPGSRVLEALGYSLLTALAVTLLSTLIGLPAGRALALRRFRGKTVVTFLILAPTVMPVISVAMGIHVAFLRYGLADSLPGVILVHLVPVTPYMVLILTSVFSGYNVDYEAQARTLGATPLQVVRHVMLPLIFPGMLVGAMFAFIISWSQYLLTLLIGGGQVMTLPVLLFSFANSGDHALTAALSLVFVAPALIFLLLSTRHLSGERAALGGFGKL